MSHTLLTRSALLATLALGAACTEVGDESDADSMTALLPTEDDVRINLPMGASAAKGTSDWAEYYVVTRQVTEHVNGMIKIVLGTVWYVVDNFEPTWSDADSNQAVWGPWSDSGLDPVETGLWVRAEDDGSHTWAIFFVPKGGTVEDDAEAVVAGVVDAGSTAQASSGIFIMDFDLAGAMDPAVNEHGQFYVEYVKDDTGVAAVAAFQDFGDSEAESVNALYAYEQDALGGGQMDLAWLEDINAGGEVELLTMKTRWTETGLGRADATASGGDLGAASVTASECWDESFSTTYWTDSIGFGEATGAESDCFFGEAEYASEASFEFTSAE